MHLARRCLTEEHCSCDAYACLLINHVSLLGRNIVWPIGGMTHTAPWESRRASIRHKARLSAPCCFVRPDECGGVSSLQRPSGPLDIWSGFLAIAEHPRRHKSRIVWRASPREVLRHERTRCLALSNREIWHQAGKKKNQPYCSASSPTRKLPADSSLVSERAQSPECCHQRAASSSKVSSKGEAGSGKLVNPVKQPAIENDRCGPSTFAAYPRHRGPTFP